MRFDTLIVAKAAVGADELNVLGMGVTRITPVSLPWREFQLALVLRFFVDEEDLSLQVEERSIVIDVLNPNGDVLPGGVTFPVSTAVLRVGYANTVPGEARLLNFVAHMAHVTFPEPGLYYFVARLDNVEVGRYPLVLLELAQEENQTTEANGS